jgi:hypothetical protein
VRARDAQQSSRGIVARERDTRIRGYNASLPSDESGFMAHENANDSTTTPMRAPKYPLSAHSSPVDIVVTTVSSLVLDDESLVIADRGALQTDASAEVGEASLAIT